MRPRCFGMIPASRASTWELDGSPEVGLVYIRRETVDELAADEFGVDSSALHIEPRLGFEDALLEQLVLSLLDTARHAEPMSGSGLWADPGGAADRAAVAAHLLEPGVDPANGG